MKLLVFVLACLFFSCGSEKPAHFTVSGTEAELFAKTRAAQEGLLDFSGSKKLEYRFYESFTIPSNSSFVIEYSFSVLPSQPVQDNFSLVLNMGDSSWELPMDSNGIQYLIPVDNSFSGSFNVSLEAKNKPVIKIPKKDAPVLEISFIGFTERKFGFNTSSEKVMLTPFVNIIDNAQSSETVYVIDVPESLREKKFAEINAVFTGGQASPEATPAAALEISGRKIESFPGAGRIYIPPALYSGNKAVFSWKPASGSKIESFELKFEDPPVFPNPIKADPVFIITWQRANWRNTEYELFRWDRFPSILFFDYADYAAQDRMLKRLAFYVEKAGFRGRLAADSEIAHLHGWNAHNYRAEDLARFFDTARKTNFPLLDEELQLEKILLNEGIIRESQNVNNTLSIVPGEGAILSITRESPDYLRYRFMAHEGFHGLFFIDEDFRNFCRQRWEQLPAAAKRFIVSYFDFQQYDTSDEYLLVNEFMGHILQQSASQAADYFGRQLPQRLESTWRTSSLPPKDAGTGVWTQLATAFNTEAQALSAYVNQRWGLAAGRVWGLRISNL